MRRLLLLLLLLPAVLSVAACSTDPGAALEPDEPDTTTAPPSYCEGETSFDWDPAAATRLVNFPDGYFQDDDGTLRFDAAAASFIETVPEQFQLVYTQLSTLDGFGTTAGLFLGFTGSLGELPDGEAESMSDGRLRLIELSAPPKRVPYELRRTDDGKTILLLPMVPLRAATPHLVVLTTEAQDKRGACVNPGSKLRAALDGNAEDPRVVAVAARLIAGLEAANIDKTAVSAALAFTTQSIVNESVAIAAQIANADVNWTGDADCAAPEELFRRCDRPFNAADYRGADHIVTDKPVTAYEMPLRFWLPPTGEGPWPTVVFGHGLSGDRKQAELLAKAATPLGIVVVAIDAAEHGDHPAGTRGSELEQVLAFFGISIASLSLDPLWLRDNWRQSTFDKLHLVRLLQTHADLDGDGKDDVDPDHLIYFGVSLGAIMGPEMLSLNDAFGIGILSVGGSRVSTIIQEAAQFSIVIDLMKPPGTTDGDVARFFPVLQTLLERGDSGNYAPFVIRERLEGAGPAPHLLVTNVLNDDTVPPGTNRMLARALGAPHVPPVLEPVGIIPMADAAPVAGNYDGGLTAGFFQYDRITEAKGDAPKEAKHSNMAKSREAILQTVTFIQTWLDSGTPTIVDPYAELETPEL